MEYLFENVYVDTEKLLCQVYGNILCKKRTLWTAVAIVLTILFAVMGLILDKTAYLLGTVVYGVLAIWYWMWPYRIARKSYKNMLKRYDGEIPATTVRFGETITFSQEDSVSSFPYEKIKTVCLLKDCMLLKNEVGDTHYFPNDGFTKGTTQELLVFLKQKCPQLKLPDWQW